MKPEVKNPYGKLKFPAITGMPVASECFQEGAEAYHTAVVEWLWQECTEHSYDYHGQEDHKRKDCPTCMKELKGE